jgi:uncharacterized protein
MPDKKLKTISKGLQSVNDALRQITFVASSEAVDRYGDIVRIAGVDTANYAKNPVVLAFHDSTAMPVGKAVAITKTVNPAQLLITVQFCTPEENPDGDKIYRLYKGGYMSAVSVGFIPLDVAPRTDENGRVCGWEYLTSELLELSAVPVPANPEALSKGFDFTKMFEPDANVQDLLKQLFAPKRTLEQFLTELGVA